ncbi:unnamed protein product [Brassica oleracea]|uniref:Uncharacterized protein n=1 Tax=Brassica oleracea TaxID=3712 RepID=A0A3P6EFE0_BRAOL|nr:unnamed protein product [Brassica oleracea]
MDSSRVLQKLNCFYVIISLCRRVYLLFIYRWIHRAHHHHHLPPL